MWAFLLLAGIGLFFYVQFKKLNTKTVHRHKKKLPPAQAPIAETPTRPDPRYASTNRRGSLKKEDSYTSHSAAAPMQFMVPQPENIEYAWRTGDFDTARRLLQKHSYTMKNKDVTDRDRAEFTRLMTEFANEDPLYKIIIKPIKTLVELEPGILQSALSKRLTAAGANIEQVRYVLYFAHELNHIHRVKHGRSYKLYPAGETIQQQHD